MCKGKDLQRQPVTEVQVPSGMHSDGSVMDISPRLQLTYFTTSLSSIFKRKEAMLIGQKDIV
jgi:hypothetical protein